MSTYHWFNHLLDGQGSLIAQADGPSLLPTSWRSGDLVLNWFDFDLVSGQGAEARYVRLGMYSFPGTVNVPVRGPGGELLGEWLLVELPGG